MMENETLEQEVTETESPTTESQVAPDQVTPVPATPSKSLDHNIRELRLKAERSEREAQQYARERDELLRRMSESKPTAQQEEENFSIGDSDLVEGKHITKINKQYENRIKKLEQQIHQNNQQTQESLIETRIKAQYPDFSSVVSEDNIAMLRIQYPEIAQTINTSTDLYSKAVSAYTMIKKLGIQLDDNTLLDKHRINQNQLKPRPMASINPQQSDSPLTKANAFANGLTEELKSQLLREMREAIKNK